MAIIAVEWQPHLAIGTLTVQSLDITHTWCVSSDTLADSAYVIATQSRGIGSEPGGLNPVPNPNDPLKLGNEDSQYLLARSYSPVYQIETGKIHKWHLRVTYRNVIETLDGGGQPQPLPPNPCDRPTLWHIETGGSYSRELDVDLDGKPVLNSCGEPFDPQLTTEDSLPMLVANRRECNWSEIVANVLQYNNSINSTTFLGQPARTFRCHVVAGQLQWEGEYPFYPVAYRFEFNERGWDAYVLDLGHNPKDLDDHQHPPRDEKDELPLVGPWPLDGNCRRAKGLEPEDLERFKGPWQPQTAYLVGDITSNVGNFYLADFNGTSGDIPPTHTEGSASDGGIFWTFMHIGRRDMGPFRRYRLEDFNDLNI